MRTFQIVLYEKENGRVPVKEFILEQDGKMRAKILSMLELLAEKGNTIREPYSKYLKEGLFELRCQTGNDIARVLYFFCFENTIVITNGFIKKTQRTPLKEIQIAKQRRTEYMERVKRNGNVK